MTRWPLCFLEMARLCAVDEARLTRREALASFSLSNLGRKCVEILAAAGGGSVVPDIGKGSASDRGVGAMFARGRGRKQAAALKPSKGVMNPCEFQMRRRWFGEPCREHQRHRMSPWIAP